MSIKINMYSVANSHADIRKEFQKLICKGCIYKYSALTEGGCLRKVLIRLVENNNTNF